MSGASLSSRIENFVFRGRARESAPIGLHWRRIYILPTRHGLTYAFTLLLLFVASINYTLSLGYLLTFFLTAIGIVAMLHTFRNLRGLHIRWRTPEPVFAGENAAFPLIFENIDGGDRFAIDIFSQEGHRQPLDVRRESTLVHIPMKAIKRGILRPERIIVETRYPLGLFRAWVRLSPDMQCIAYPAPAQENIPLPMPEGTTNKGTAHIADGDELQFLRAYQLGDSPRRIAWRAFARGRGLLTKQFGAEGGEEIWIDLNEVPETNLEAKLSHLTGLVLDADLAGLHYGLRLAGTEIAPAHGEAHRNRCLEQLAFYEA